MRFLDIFATNIALLEAGASKANIYLKYVDSLKLIVFLPSNLCLKVRCSILLLKNIAPKKVYVTIVNLL